MIVLADRNFGATGLLADLAATGADALVRLKIGRKLAVLRRLPDGSYLSMLGTLRVRIIECEITSSPLPDGAPGCIGWPPPCSTTGATPPAS
jgi:hypothetical protein